MFNRFARLFAARRTREDAHPEVSRIPPQARSQAGVYVTPDRALTNDVVWACVHYLSSTVAQLPWHVKRELDSGASEIVRRHPVGSVLSYRPNPECSPFQFRETLVGWALLWGNGYAEIVRDASGRVIELWPIHPSRVEVRRDLETDGLFYRVNGYQRGQIDLNPRDVFHLRGFGDGPVGLNVAEYAAQSIGWAQATALFGASFFGNGLNMAGFIETPHSLSPEARDRMRAELNRMFRGPRRAHRWSFLDLGAKFNKLTATPDEAQFVATMQHQVEVICRWFRVPPHKVMHLLRGTFSNIEHQSIEVVIDSVTPWVTRLEQEADFKLFGGNRQGFYTDIDLRGLMRGDAKARGEYYKMMRETGALNANEIRAFEGENSMGPQGDKYVMQSQYTTLERIGEEPAAAPAPRPAPQPEQEDQVASEVAESVAARMAHLQAALDERPVEVPRVAA